MFEQSLFAVVLNHRTFGLNVAALLMACAGSWLLIATRVRTSRASARLLLAQGRAAEYMADARTQRVNRVFFSIGLVALCLALLLSMHSAAL